MNKTLINVDWIKKKSQLKNLSNFSKINKENKSFIEGCAWLPQMLSIESSTVHEGRLLNNYLDI